MIGSLITLFYTLVFQYISHYFLYILTLFICKLMNEPIEIKFQAYRDFIEALNKQIQKYEPYMIQEDIYFLKKLNYMIEDAYKELLQKEDTSCY